MADRSGIGKEYPSFTWEVERGKIRELVQAIGDANPIYSDREAAIREGYKDVVASPTFITVPTIWSGEASKVVKDLKINFSRMLHGEERYEYFREIYPGDVLMGSYRVANIETKSGKTGDMDIVTEEKIFTNQRNEPVIKVTTVLVEKL